MILIGAVLRPMVADSGGNIVAGRRNKPPIIGRSSGNFWH
jgi:hypothetical protein